MGHGHMTTSSIQDTVLLLTYSAIQITLLLAHTELGANQNTQIFFTLMQLVLFLHSISHSTNTAFKKIISTPKADDFP